MKTHFQPIKQSRLSTQGFINDYRKRIFSLLAVILTAYLLLSPIPWHLSAIEMLAAEFAGIMLVFAGILGRILATISIGGQKDRKVIHTELYSICRNPLYFASFLMAIGVGFLTGRLDFLLLITAAYLAVFYPMMLNEAKYLRDRFEDFADYEAKVPLFFPKFNLWQERDRFEISFRLVKRTLLDASLALLVVPVVVFVRACG
jgi:protein-S-isoprenylcysteine O-methyltransferase Ste14